MGRRLSGLDLCVLEGVSDCIVDNNLIPAVVGDGVVEQLRRSGIQFLVVFSGDLGGHLLEHLAGLGAQITRWVAPAGTTKVVP